MGRFSVTRPQQDRFFTTSRACRLSWCRASRSRRKFGFAPDSRLEGTGFEILAPLEDCG
jgi:hypothetical protein